MKRQSESWWSNVAGVERKPYIHPIYGECTNHRPRSMPIMFNELADYNGRVAKGIVHTEKYRDRMAHLQRQFYEWKQEEGGYEHP
jgi:hypothetical protein